MEEASTIVGVLIKNFKRSRRKELYKIDKGQKTYTS